MHISMSRPARGAWIEMREEVVEKWNKISRAPQGARGLKYFGELAFQLGVIVAPRKGRVD